MNKYNNASYVTYEEYMNKHNSTPVYMERERENDSAWQCAAHDNDVEHENDLHDDAWQMEHENGYGSEHANNYHVVHEAWNNGYGYEG